jgi:hypothetical protein
MENARVILNAGSVKMADIPGIYREYLHHMNQGLTE